MATIINKRMTAELEGDFVVFLIGMRVNNWWKIHKWLPVVMAMPKMLKEVSVKKEIGCLGFQQSLTTIIQYWRSFEHLEAYARNTDKEHYPEWVKFNKRVGSNGDVGIWHETFKVTNGNYECIYNNMPLFGLAKASKAVLISSREDSANARMGKSDETTL